VCKRSAYAIASPPAANKSAQPLEEEVDVASEGGVGSEGCRGSRRLRGTTEEGRIVTQRDLYRQDDEKIIFKWKYVASVSANRLRPRQ
jgi:hypothetical protein